MTSTKEQSIHAVHEKFARIVELYWMMEKLPRTYGTNERFTGAEIQLIETIGDHNGSLSVTDLAKRLGITKGAVSQRLKKLNKRGFIIKGEDPENISKVRVSLTSKGKSAHFAHKHWHEKVDGGYMEYYRRIDDDKMSFLIEFMTQVEGFLVRALNMKD
jgi:DNA-binding MarR family transcriptional regulator